MVDTMQNPAVEVEEEDDAADWLVVPPKTVRLRPLTVALVLVAAIAAGLWGGAAYQKHHGTASASTTRSASATGTAGGPGGQSGASASATSGTVTSGTVTAVDGEELTVRTTAGASKEVTLSSSTIVTRSGSGRAGDISVGDTVSVQGATSGGELKASAVTATAKGVTATGGGFGGPPSGGFSGG